MGVTERSVTTMDQNIYSRKVSRQDGVSGEVLLNREGKKRAHIHTPALSRMQPHRGVFVLPALLRRSYTFIDATNCRAYHSTDSTVKQDARCGSRSLSSYMARNRPTQGLDSRIRQRRSVSMYGTPSLFEMSVLLLGRMYVQTTATKPKKSVS